MASCEFCGNSEIHERACPKSADQGPDALTRAKQYHESALQFVRMMRGARANRFEDLIGQSMVEATYAIAEELAVLNSDRRQLAALENWKKEALEVIAKWDAVADFTRDHGRIGYHLPDETLRILQAAESRVDDLALGMHNAIGWLDGLGHKKWADELRKILNSQEEAK
jgi:hypothetical protein